MTLDANAIRAAEQRIRPYIRRTPVIETDGADFGLDGARLFFKLELLQHTGSFKPRGASANRRASSFPRFPLRRRSRASAPMGPNS